MAVVLSQEVASVRLDEVRPHPRNPRQGDVGAIYESIQETGFYGALIVQRSTGFILAGTHRWLAARHAGLEEVPVIFVDVGDEQALRILLADNRTNDLAHYDDSALKDLLEEVQLATGSLAGTGFSVDDLQGLIEQLRDPVMPPSPFQPNLSPELTVRTHTEGDVAEAAERLESQFDGERPLKATMCPACGTEFYVD